MIGKFSELPYHTKSPPGDAHSRAWKMLPFGNRAWRENSTLWNSFSLYRKLRFLEVSKETRVCQTYVGQTLAGE